MMALGKTKALFYRDIAIFLIRLLLLFGGIYLGYSTQIGILYGALIGNVIAAFISSFWNMHLLASHSKISIRDQLIVVIRPVVAVITMVVLVRWFGSVGVTDYWSSINKLALTIVLGAVIYVACLLYTSPSPRDQRGSRMPSSA